MKSLRGNLRLNVLGAKGVGKSAITVRYLTKRFIGEYSSGLDISYQTTICKGDNSIKVDILDTSSQGDHQASCHDVYDADAFLLVYSITDPASLAVAARELGVIRTNCPTPRAPVLLVGNKLDLDHARKVSPEDVERLTVNFGCRHVEVSAAEGHFTIVENVLSLISETHTSLCLSGRHLKRRKSLFENVSRKLGSVFRRKSLEDTPVSHKKLSRLHHHFNRRSV